MFTVQGVTVSLCRLFIRHQHAVNGVSFSYVSVTRVQVDDMLEERSWIPLLLSTVSDSKCTPETLHQLNERARPGQRSSTSLCSTRWNFLRKLRFIQK